MSNNTQESPADAFARFLSEHPGAEIVVSTDVWDSVVAKIPVVEGRDSAAAMVGVGVRVDSRLSPGTVVAIDRKSVDRLFASERWREVTPSKPPTPA